MTTTVTRTEEVQAREQRHVLQTYRRQPVVFVRGEGVRLYDAEGREYLDLLSGIGVAALGHAHPALVRAISEQAGTLMHTSNLFFHPLQGQLAERLAGLSGLPRAFFCNSGAEAVEACLKFARRYWYTRGEPRPEIVALEGSFHGRTIGALSVTSDEHYRAPFEPLLSGITWTPVNDPGALAAAVSNRTAAIIAEPIQGEGGIHPLTPAFAAAIGEASARTGALVIADEIQCGLGRTGYPFYFAALGMKPHLVSLGKALGGGVPIGAGRVREVGASTNAKRGNRPPHRGHPARGCGARPYASPRAHASVSDGIGYRGLTTTSAHGRSSSTTAVLGSSTWVCCVGLGVTVRVELPRS